jgi:hypothetical protein
LAARLIKSITAKNARKKVNQKRIIMTSSRNKLPIRISNKEPKTVIVFKKRIAETFGHTLFVEHRKK